MEERGIDDLANLQSYVPSLHIGQEQDGFKISLRGIGLQGTSSISDSGVAFYIDNNYIPRPAGGTAVFYDIERIEVLRGPQGTLYGRNATGGVVNVISNRPVDELEGEIGISAGSRNLAEIRGVINVPIADNVAGRLSAVYTEEDGYVENLSNQPGTDDFFGTNGDTTIRAQLLFGTPETVEILRSGSYSDLDGTGINMTYLERNIGGPPPTQALLATLPADSTDPLKTNNDSPAFNKTETDSYFVRATKDFDTMEAVLQIGVMDQTSNLLQDFDGSSVDISVFNKDQDNESESVEFRLSSDDGSALTWIAGAYYFSEDTYIFRRVRLNGLTPGGVINLPDFLLDEWGESETKAVFGTVTYAFRDDLRGSLGLRHTEDEKSGTKITRGNFGAPFPPDVPNALYPGKADFSETTWRVGLEWDATEDVFVYATVSNGYKAGGFNLTSSGLP
ncbi:MAG: TonB-dependent receptor, partial [Firmicutes bacterium]|nr:TonB-dependent receptor [Bacillota bacterium]